MSTPLPSSTSAAITTTATIRFGIMAGKDAVHPAVRANLSHGRVRSRQSFWPADFSD